MSTENQPEWERKFDEKFPIKTINHHHYVRVRYLKDFIRSFALTLLDDISRDMDMSFEYKEAIKQKYGL